MAKKQETSKRPGRDPLSVGLDRYNKKTGLQLPPFVEEYGGWFAAVVVIGLFIIPMKFLGCFDSPAGPVQPTAFVRVVAGPIKTWASGSSTQIESVAVEVENLGPEVADGVSVQIKVRSMAFPLTGPQKIDPKQRMKYFGSTGLNVTSEDIMEVQISCTNCPPPGSAIPLQVTTASPK